MQKKSQEKIPKHLKDKWIIKSWEKDLHKQGKECNVYWLGYSLIIIKTDRISANDFVFSTEIPKKGEICTALDHFWRTHILADFKHHLVKRGNSKKTTFFDTKILSKELKKRTIEVYNYRVPPYEMIYRKAFTESSSVWKEYEKKGTAAGKKLRKRIKKWEIFPDIIFTPSTKEQDAHDKNITIDEFDEKTNKKGMKAVAIQKKMFERVFNYATLRGFLFLDTKLEGFETLLDEAFTPIGSRILDCDEHARLLKEGGQPKKSYDKDILRRWTKTIETDFYTKEGKQIIGLKNLDPLNPVHIEFVHKLEIPHYIVNEMTRRFKEFFVAMTDMELEKYQEKYFL